MAIQTPEKPDTARPHQDIDAGVIEDARNRQRRHRLVAASLVATAAAAAAIGLVLGFSGGGSGSGASPRAHGHAQSPGAAVHTPVQAVATLTHVPPTINTFGLLAPNEGWVANGIGFYLTRDGGRSWGALEQFGDGAVPGLGLNGDVGPSITATASPTPSTLVIGFDDSKAWAGCHSTPSVGGGAVAYTADDGVTWRTTIMPGCAMPGSLSFISASTGFALAGRGWLYKTTDGARIWRRVAVSSVAARPTIDFTSVNDGWALGNNETGLYRTTDGGRTWQRASICSDAGATACGSVHFFGSRGLVNAWEIDPSTHAVSPLVYTTADNGRTWSRHTVPVSGPVSHDGLPIFSAPTADDLFVLYAGALERSTDGGRTWSSSRHPILGPSGQDMSFVNADYGWVEYEGRLYATTDGGRHWKPLGSR